MTVDVTVPLAVKVTPLGLTEVVGHTMTRPDDEIVAPKLTVPDSPLRLVSVIVEVPDDPMTIVSALGLAPMLKSGDGGGGVSFHAARG